MEQSNIQPSTTYKTFGIISLVLGIVAFVFSFIPCLGIYAIYPGIIGVVLGVVGFVMANKVNGEKGVVIAGIILSLLGTAVAFYQYQRLEKAAHELEKTLKDTNQLKKFEKSLDSAINTLDSVK